MKWLTTVRRLRRGLAQRLSSRWPVRRKELWIEELEERIVPNAIWSD